MMMENQFDNISNINLHSNEIKISNKEIIY